MKFLSALFALIVLAPVLCFALSNTQAVTVTMWPFSGAAEMPLYLVALTPLVFGLVFGGVWGWAGGLRHRFQARRLHKELGTLNDKIGELQKAVIVQQVQAAPKKPFWKRQS